MASQSVTELGPTRRMRGLDRALEILDFLRENRQPARPHEVAIAIGAPKSTAYELINLLLKSGILEYADRDGRVFLGRRLYFLGLAYQSHFDLTRECNAFLDHLAEVTHETSQLCMLDGSKYVVAMMREGERPFNISSDLGKPIPLPWTASGRLLVSTYDRRGDSGVRPGGRFHPPQRLAARSGRVPGRGAQGARRRILLVRHACRQFHALLRGAGVSGLRSARRRSVSLRRAATPSET